MRSEFIKVLGIDPAPSKESVIFDGEKFLHFDVRELKEYIESESKREDSLFISWDAPLSAALDDNNFSLSIRKIERFFNLNGRYAKSLGIPRGISTLGFSGCPHWSISQYIFSYPILNSETQLPSKFKLLMDENELTKSGHYITEIHPALSMWILLKDVVKEELFIDSWKYKGDSSQETKLRKAVLIENILALEIVKKVLKVEVEIKSDDELDAFVCWLMGTLLVHGDSSAKIYGDNLNGSFLLPYNKLIHEKLDEYLYK